MLPLGGALLRHGRSMPTNPAGLPGNPTASMQPPDCRSRSQPLNGYDVSGADAPIRMGDLEVLLERMSMRQDERHREQTLELQEQTRGLQARLSSLEKHFEPSFSSSGHGPATRGRKQVMRTRQRASRSELDQGRTNEAVDSQNEDEEGNEGNEGGDEEEPSKLQKKEKAKHQAAIQKYSTQIFRGACGVKGKDWPDPDDVRINPATGVNIRKI
ncbi:hypothetical protein GGX14DRAFT_397487 [Mycena pura]|uniref:Uncharacterized protein n=1 Tax=Mycena pura TaxID=153505 RepID=A0AAD6VAN3_9AGAR|nr:hypothetical protein GGX14DRAFT_397487 [Mycena pura]